jgi:cellulose synthase/poly-beta-1,6-N-acetylglucosamine synthase-like glycosyltransferase
MPHFRAAALRRVGGWDPYNVTEDADLGIRMARFGYRSGVIASTTYEEAPSRLGPWLRQRTRWFKGWMQTLIVHMREPRRLWREVGGAGAAAFYLLVGGTTVAALVQPFVLARIVASGFGGMALYSGPATSIFGALGWVHFVSLLAGYASAAMLALIGLKRRGLLHVARAFVALPLLWLLLSFAAWRALVQLLLRPHLWEKTQHGNARTSRRAARARLTDSGADPRRPPAGPV